jgi:hypothetical protein
MSDPRFDILFGGELLPGFASEVVGENLGKLFKATPETVIRLLAGGVHTLKKGVDLETALKYQAAMQRAGAKAILREIPSEAPAETGAANARQSAPAAPVTAVAAPGSALSLARSGGELLEPHERRAPEPVQVDISGITLAPVFAAVPEPEGPPPPPAPDTSHISIAAPGADLLEGHHSPPPPPAPDTSGMSIAPPGERLAPVVEQPPIPLPDLSAISLAPPGTPLDTLKPERMPLQPDISALALTPLDTH